MATKKSTFGGLLDPINILTSSEAVDAVTKKELGVISERLELTAGVLDKLANLSEVYLYVCDYYTGDVLMSNEKYASYMGCVEDEIVGRKCWEFILPGLNGFCPFCPREKLLDENGRPGKPYVWENYVERFDKWLRITNEAIYWVDGRLAHLVSFLDISGVRRTQEQLKQLAYYDRTLHLPNQLKLCTDLEETKPEKGTYLISFDIVSLRDVNNAYSRAAGDELLGAIVAWVKGLKLPGSEFYRIDGDEFALLITKRDPGYAERLARMIFARFEKAWDITIKSVPMQLFCCITMGLIDVCKYYDGPENLLGLIEQTLNFSYKRDNFAIYNKAVNLEYKNDILLEISLKNCVRDGMSGFEVYYQPIIEPVTGRWIALEALCRWTSPEFGQISPLVFIQKAEQTGLIGKLGIWVLETAVRRCKEWKLDEHPGFILDVNLSPMQLLDNSFEMKVMSILKTYGYPGNKLGLEITESTEFNFESHTLDAIKRLRALDIKILLDDFGTGYSSFDNLKQLPVCLLKTERKFIANIENDDYLKYLLRAVVDLAHVADMQLIAEGVETEQQMDILMANGADWLQGYLFSKPLPPVELAKRLDKFNAC